MNSRLEDQLRTAFEEASDFVHPRPELASRARASARRLFHRQVIFAAATACALLVAAAAGYFAVGPFREPTTIHPKPFRSRVIMRTAAGTEISDLAVHGPYLYVVTALPTGLDVYNWATGRLIRRISSPGYPTNVTIGPGGSVWLNFVHSGLWLLSPDLRLHSSDPAVSYPIVPTGRTTAFAVTQRGVVSVTVPAPGQPGEAIQRLLPGSSLLGNADQFTWAGLLGKWLAVQQTNSLGGDSHLVVAGRPGAIFGGGLKQQVNAVTSTGGSLWATIYPTSETAPYRGSLVQLDPDLRVITPTAIDANPALRKVEYVWSMGHTIWVSTASAGHALACFTDVGQAGPVVAMPVRGRVVFLAASGETVYTTTQQSNADGRWAVTSYPVPAACR